MNPRRNLQRHRLNQKRHQRWLNSLLNNQTLQFHPKAFEMVWEPSVHQYAIDPLHNRFDIIYGTGAIKPIAPLFSAEGA